MFEDAGDIIVHPPHLVFELLGYGRWRGAQQGKPAQTSSHRGTITRYTRVDDECGVVHPLAKGAVKVGDHRQTWPGSFGPGERTTTRDARARGRTRAGKPLTRTARTMKSTPRLARTAHSSQSSPFSMLSHLKHLAYELRVLGEVFTYVCTSLAICPSGGSTSDKAKRKATRREEKEGRDEQRVSDNTPHRPADVDRGGTHLEDSKQLYPTNNGSRAKICTQQSPQQLRTVDLALPLALRLPLVARVPPGEAIQCENSVNDEPDGGGDSERRRAGVAGLRLSAVAGHVNCGPGLDRRFGSRFRPESSRCPLVCELSLSSSRAGALKVSGPCSGRWSLYSPSSSPLLRHLVIKGIVNIVAAGNQQTSWETGGGAEVQDIEDADDNDDGLDEEEAEEGSSTCTHQAHQIPPALAAHTACVLSVDTGPRLQRKRFFIVACCQSGFEAMTSACSWRVGALEAGVAQGCVAAFVDHHRNPVSQLLAAPGVVNLSQGPSMPSSFRAPVVGWTSEAKAGEEYNHGTELPRAKTAYAVVPSVIGSMSEMDDGLIFGRCCTQSRGVGVGGQAGAGCMTVHIQTSELEQLLCMCGGEDEELAVVLCADSSEAHEKRNGRTGT
ncbi:hypothetical protein DFP72DRAFT_860979 [Ephemerocybe angulata]|uniref:Uncharacterized protein n=1 Tax=Ephemerocybe angulata TaxID=980116 RepID=A0A8H6LVD0_9AGAR|nr:hypothetical protein DFP72DRAFT_860979 [Tulosesus angulatus]